jgi:hypothetical protein
MTGPRKTGEHNPETGRSLNHAPRIAALHHASSLERHVPCDLAGSHLNSAQAASP